MGVSRDPSLEMDEYAPGRRREAADSRPLLGHTRGASSTSVAMSPTSPRGGSFPPSSSSARWGGRQRCGRPRLLRPLAIILLPILSIILYTAVVQPMFPDLPALPRIRIDTGSTGANESASLSDGSKASGTGQTPMFVTPQSCVCGATDRGKQLCQNYHPQGLEASRLVPGSGARMRKFLDKASSGEEIKIGILGGSISACRGVHSSPEYKEGDPNGPGCYTQIIKRWFQQTFPGTPVALLNGAIGAMDSSYYAFCGNHHLRKDVDLVIVEFDVNDQTGAAYMMFFDQLLRVLLEFEKQPAVLILGAWSPRVAQDQGYNDPQIAHMPVARYYDVPYVSLKRLIFNHYLRFPESTTKAFFFPDDLHPNARGHRLLADLAISYFESELCMLKHFGIPDPRPVEETIATTEPANSLVDVSADIYQPHMSDKDEFNFDNVPDNWETTFDINNLERIGNERRHFALPRSPYDPPVVSMFTPLELLVDPHKPDPENGDHVLDIVQPELFCADANSEENPIEPTIKDGWRPWAWRDEKHYWVADDPGATIRVDIRATAGRVAVYYFRSRHYDLGDALCWVDDNEDGAVNLPGYWDREYNMATVQYIDRNLTVGAHYVTCRVSEETSHPSNPNAHHFRIVAIMAT